jgi:hypothetical protein
MGLTVKGQSPWNTRAPCSALRFSTNREFRGPYASPGLRFSTKREFRAPYASPGLRFSTKREFRAPHPPSGLRFSTNRELRAPDGAIAAIDAYERNPGCRKEGHRLGVSERRYLRRSRRRGS